MLRIAILAPALALRAGLRIILAPPSPQTGPAGAFDVVYEAGSLAEFLAYAPPTDVLILDSSLASASALEELSGWGEGNLGLLLLSDSPAPARPLAEMSRRGWGILPLDSSIEELHAAVGAVGEGLLVGAPLLLGALFSRSLISPDTTAEGAVGTLTDRELQVLQLLGLGMANKQIALQLNLSEHTVKFHISSIFGKLGVANRTEAVRQGVQSGLIAM